MQRRKFLQSTTSAFLLLASGEVVKAEGSWLSNLSAKKLKLRFAVASDGHYGQPNTDYENYFKSVVDHINNQHTSNPFAFCMINGDIIHDDKAHCPAAKAALDRLQVKYYVSQGNHDKLTADEWMQTWKMPINLHFSIKKNSFVIASTSNETGTYLCPDLGWMSTTLEKLKRQKNVFVFIHINPVKLTTNAVDCPELLQLLTKYKNVRAVFNGHDHDEEKIKVKENVPFVFDAHFGGSWGTDYRGYRIVELYSDNSVATWVMNPENRINEAML
ncbi:MAG: metallophosphoesterase [Saprospiraceae bacterium]|nr:metallophosphoesterase [Saprospiraceae bacterium]